MGDALVIYKVMPEDMESFEKIKEGIRNTITVEDMKEEPIAFGLKALIVAIRVKKDDEKALEEIEEKLKSIDGVESVTMERATLI